MEGPQGQPQSQFCRILLIFFRWSQLRHNSIPFLTHLRKLFQTPDIVAVSKTHQLYAHKPAQISKPAESLQNGNDKLTRTYSTRHPSHRFFFSWTVHSKTLTRQHEQNLNKRELLQIKVGKKLQSWGAFMENMLVASSKKLWFWDLYRALGRETCSPQRSLLAAQGRACATTTLPRLQEQAVKQQQPVRYPWNSSSVGDAWWEKQEERQQL